MMETAYLFKPQRNTSFPTCISKRQLEAGEYYYLIFFHFVDKYFCGVLD